MSEFRLCEPPQSQTIEQQLERLQTHCQAQQWAWQDVHIFRDEGSSGATLHRPGLEHLRDQVATGGFDQVIITAPDRLARKYVHQMLLIEELEGHGGPGPLLGATHGRGSQ
jgi:site-specific DNA recombinase